TPRTDAVPAVTAQFPEHASWTAGGGSTTNAQRAAGLVHPVRAIPSGNAVGASPPISDRVGHRWGETPACRRRNSDGVAGFWAHWNASLGARLRLRRSWRIDGPRRSCRSGAYRRAGDRRRRELF